MKKMFHPDRLIVFVALFLIVFSSGIVNAQQATWIWYPGDYDIWLSNNMQNRRDCPKIAPDIWNFGRKPTNFVTWNVYGTVG